EELTMRMLKTSTALALAALIEPCGVGPAAASALRATASHAEAQQRREAGPYTVRHATYQGRNRGAEQTERFSRKIRIGRNGSLNVGNISGDIAVTGGRGDEVSSEAVKQERGYR